jgi:hypothetical protein
MQAFSQIGLKASKPQRVNLALLCQTLAVSPNCHLATLVLGWPLPGQRENLIQRLRRFLKQDGLPVADYYTPWVRHLFAHWSGREVSLVMDRTDIEDRWSVLTLGVTYRHRLLPLAWDVVSFGATSAERQITLLQRIQPYVPSLERVRVNLYADSEFRAVSVQRTCQGYGWHWQVGLKSDLAFHTGDGHWQPLRTLNVQRGERRYVRGIYLNQDHPLGPLNLIAAWSLNQEAPRYWSLDQPADAHAWRWGRKRYWIEPTHRDWKSYGFDLERSQLDDAERLTVLMLGINITTLWMMHLGDRLLRTGRATELAPQHKTDYSAFRLGRDYVQRCRTLGRWVPVGFTVQHSA